MRLFVPVLLLLLCFCNVADSAIINVDWWSNKTSSNRVVEFASGGFLRLEAGWGSGFLEGTFTLPDANTWEIDFSVRTDDGFDIPDESVDVFVDGTKIQRVFNTPPGSFRHQFSHQVIGDQFDYRFEFSTPVTHDNLVVEPGAVSAVPEPSALAIWGLLTVGAGGIGYFRRRKSDPA